MTASARKTTAKARRTPKRVAKRRGALAGAFTVPNVRHHAAVLGGIAVALAAAFHVWTGIRVASLGYERSRAIELSQHLENQREQLADELASLLRTEHLEAESERRLGLGPPTAGQVVDLRTKQVALAKRGEP